MAMVLLAACATVPHTFDGDPWIEARSEHFLIRSSAPAKDAIAAARALERVREALLLGSWHGNALPDRTIALDLLSGETAMRELFPKGLVGVATQDPFDQLLLVANAEESPSEVPVLKHELAHAIDRSFLTRSPRWLDEGLASYLETLELNDDSVVIGEVNHERALALRRIQHFDFASVLNAGPEIYLASERDAEDFYSSSWLLVHMLINQHLDGFNSYLSKLARGEEPAAAFAEAFPGLDAQALDIEAAAYLRGGAFYKRKLPLPEKPIEVATRAMSAAEIRERRAQLELIAGRSFGMTAGKEQVANDALAALALDPGLPIAAALWAENSGATPEQRVEKARAVIAAKPDDPRGWLLLSFALRDIAREKDHHQIVLRTGEMPVLDAERVKAAERAVELAPEDPLALRELAQLRIEQARPGDALTLARHAAQNAPGDPKEMDALATALSAAGACDQSAKAEQRVLELLPDGSGADTAASVRKRIDSLAAQCRANTAAKNQASAVVSTPPAKRQCASNGPKLPHIKLKHEEEIRVTYQIAADGSVSEVKTGSTAPAALINAVLDYVKGCRFEPRPPPEAGAMAEPLSVEESYRVSPGK